MKILNVAGRFLWPAFLLAFSLAAGAAERTVYLVNDALGSPVAAMDEQGGVIWRESYAPYGERRTKEAGNPATPAYAGSPEDPGTGLVYMGARMYDPETARFSGVDPLAFRLPKLQSFNRYAYASNSPYRFKDPGGMDDIEVQSGDPVVDGALRGLSEARRYSSDTKQKIDNSLERAGEVLEVAATVGVPGGAAAGAGREFFKDATLHPRVLKQIENNDNHAFPVLVDQLAEQFGTVSKTVDRRDNPVDMLTLPGSKNGVEGAFE